MKSIMEHIGKEVRHKDKKASSHRHTEAIQYTHKVKVGTKKRWKFTGDGAWHDMFISSHPEDIRSQLS